MVRLYLQIAITLHPNGRTIRKMNIWAIYTQIPKQVLSTDIALSMMLVCATLHITGRRLQAVV